MIYPIVKRQLRKEDEQENERKSENMKTLDLLGQICSLILKKITITVIETAE